ncbi:conjugative transfer system coupling protein TraD, partial [Aquimonas sp.]|uniref:conjugative transfer system coupling protein TraD n=1 Tax=Aquimonas sp. TaxID=1872588 RepID=UPI0037C08144
KTRILDSLITQAVFRGETVIILDPKGDKDLMECARQACIADGREDDFVYFHPAFPDKSWRIDPLRNFNRATELASRIASLIPSETGADPFAAFGQMQLTNIANGILLIDEKPTLKKILTCFEGGMPHLVKSAILAYCRKTFAERGQEWEEALKRAMEGAKPDINDQANRHARFYRDYVSKHAPSQELQGLISSFTHDATHYGKMIASLLPVLTMLTSGVLGDLLSPDSEDLRDKRPITDFSRAIHNKQVVYIGLDSLSDKFVGSAIGAMFLADLTAVAGDRYNYGKDLQPVNIYVDEAAELANDPFIAMLNKAGGSKARITVATQTLGDFTSRLGSDAKTRMVLGNLNNVVALRLIDGPTQDYITETFSKTVVRHVEYSQSAKAETDEPFIFSGTTNESLKETEVALVDPPMMGALPDLEFFARISGGRLIKARIPILKSAA